MNTTHRKKLLTGRLERIRVLGTFLSSTIVFAAASILIAAVALNEHQIARTDPSGQTYYEIRARNPGGNLGGSVPLYGGSLPAKKVTVRAESFWRIADGEGGAPVNPDGSGRGKPASMNGFREPNLAPWALIARWEQFNQDPGSADFGNATPLSGYFLVGYGNKFDVPSFVPAAHTYVSLRYFCNDEDYTDNTGWLHVYETYTP